MVDVGGSVTVSGGGTAVGINLSTLVYLTKVTTELSDSAELVAQAKLPDIEMVGTNHVNMVDKITHAITGAAPQRVKTKGIYVGATGKEDVILIAVSGGGGSSTSVVGVVNTLVAKNEIKADAKGAKMKSGYTNDGAATGGSPVRTGTRRTRSPHIKDTSAQ